MIQISTFADKAPKIQYDLSPKFGTIFTSAYLKMPIRLGQQDGFAAEILPFRPEALSPGTAALHYGQSIFEGMKAYRQKDGGIAIFRADLHAARFRNSARKMVMAEVPEEVFMQALKHYVHFNRDNVPVEEGHSLYLRPLLFAADPMIKVGTSQNYSFMIMSTIAGSYFSSGAKPRRARVLISREYVRAFPGGTGEVKTAANYATSIYPQHQASQLGCDQVLYLDAIEHEYIDEMGGMNFFAVRGDELVTPSLNGCILNGVTRRSILELAASMGFRAVEERMSATRMIEDIRSGRIKEVFACGTAAVISPIGELMFQPSRGKDYESVMLPDESRASGKILETLNGVQRGHIPAPGDWLFPIRL